jgi:hypothetical protein
MRKWYGSVLLFALLLLVVWSAFGQRKKQPQVTWEYKQSGRASSTGEPELNELGAQGWELVSVNDDHTVFYLKRPK